MLSLLTVALAAAPTSVSAMSFDFSTATCDGEPFDNLDIAMTCNGAASSSCTFGDTVSIDGSVEAVSDFSDTEMTFKACVMGYCPSDNVRSAGTLCANWLVPVGNQTCGEAGMYDVTGTEIIPDADISDSFSWLVTVHIGIDDECTAEGSAAYGSSDGTSSSGSSSSSGGSGNTKGEYTMSYSMMGAIFGTAFGAAVAGRNRCLEEDDYEDEGTFVEMGETACMGV